MFLHHGYFSFCRRFHILFFKIAAWAVLHFKITCQMTSIVPGTKTVLRNRSTLGICSCAYYVALRIMSLKIMLFRIMSHSGSCRSGLYCIQTYVVWDSVVQVNVVRCNVVPHNVGVSYKLCCTATLSQLITTVVEVLRTKNLKSEKPARIWRAGKEKHCQWREAKHLAHALLYI